MYDQLTRDTLQVRLSSFSGVIHIGYQPALPYFEAILPPLEAKHEVMNEMEYGSDTSGSIGVLSDVSSVVCTDDELEEADRSNCPIFSIIHALQQAYILYLVSQASSPRQPQSSSVS